VDDNECAPDDPCAFGICVFTDLTGEGTCNYYLDPDKSDCCKYPYDCGAPPAGFVAACEMDLAAGYKTCSFIPDPEVCASPANQLVLNEFMANPAAADESTGEWIELFNPSLAPVNINGWSLADNDADKFTLVSGSPVIVPPGGYFLLARSDNPANNGGLDPDFVYYNFTLGNGADEVVLLNSAGVEVDRIEYGSAQFTTTDGASLELVSPYFNNIEATNWRTAQKPAGPGMDKGTPGKPNADAFFFYFTPAVCNDNDACTLDACGKNGQALCTHTPIQDCCQVDADCNDNNACTQDSCNPDSSICSYSPLPDCCNKLTQCDDGSDCTSDTCVNGSCRYVASPDLPDCCIKDADCKDINPCSIDFCTQKPGIPYKTCQHNSPGGKKCCLYDYECDDDAPETKDVCTTYVCQHQANPDYCTGPPPDFCNDQNPCTSDSCNLAESLCVHEPNPDCCASDTDCDDGDQCTQDVCLMAINDCDHIWIPKCCHQPQDCFPYVSDKDICKEPVCIASNCRMRHIPDQDCCLNNKDCDDKDACTTDVCNQGNNTCTHSPLGKGCCNTVADCAEDADPCTKLACIENTCVNQGLPACCKAAFQCDDDNPCTVDLCVGYTCRFVKPQGDACCLADKDCPDPAPACLTSVCAESHQCVDVHVESCEVKPNWVETFASSTSLSDLGWSSISTTGAAFHVVQGNAALGPDRTAGLSMPAGPDDATVCLVGPLVVPDGGADLSLTFEQSLSVIPAPDEGIFEAWAEARVPGIDTPVRLATFGASLPDTVSPYAAQLPFKIAAAPFSIAFCAAVPKEWELSHWLIDTVRIGVGKPPKILTQVQDLVLLFDEAAAVHVSASDPDGDPLMFSLAGPAHGQIAESSPGPPDAFADISFEPDSPFDVGSWTVTVSVNDGFFFDKQTFAEKVYVPKCESAQECDDENDCSADFCNPVSGCYYDFAPGCCNEKTPCDDADLCTTDSCLDGTCQFSFVDCNDANVCTTDSCNPAAGCMHDFNAEPCDDGSICTWQDHCAVGTCVGMSVDCGDDLPCTIDTCNHDTGCQHKSLCADKILCTTELCTVKGCKSGKVPIGSPVPDGVIDSQWPPSSVIGGGDLYFGEVALLQDEADLFVAFTVSPPPDANLVLLVDSDFPLATGVSKLSSIDPGETGLDTAVFGALSVAFPGFGADHVLAVRYGPDPLLGVETMGCAALDGLGFATESLCLITFGAEGQVEVVIPWVMLYPQGPLSGKTAAAVLALLAPDGTLLEAVPSFVADDADDVIIFGIPDEKCLTAFCGDGFVDQGEECDNGEANSDEVPNACRTNCLKAHCGDSVHDTGEECDDGQANSDTAPDACRTSCVLPKCGDSVVDFLHGEECDEGLLNTLQPDHCHPGCKSPKCGDGILDSNEACDNGPDNNDAIPDACRTACVPAFCGDGVQDSAEQCDLGAANSDVAPNACRKSCVKAHCGDGVTDFGEQCDWGQLNSDSKADACRSSCKSPSCGDKVKDSGESCDDGNNIDWDGCQGDCTILLTICGDGVPTPDEECDDGPSNSDTKPDACRTNCKYSWCGDGVVDSDEQCDDGNQAGGDTCGQDCKPYFAICGNGWVDPGEQCDDGAGNSNVLPDHCRKNCSLPKCGDAVVDSGEECDKGPGNSDTKADACRTTCKKATCGDNVKDSGEQCDQGPANSDVVPDACRKSCKSPVCGDLVTDLGHGEQCDWGPDNSDTTPDACRTDCLAAHCGDGTLDSGEVCDDGNNMLGDGCAPDCTIETYVPLPGDIVITEIMQNPSVVYDSKGEYFEVYNTRDFDIDLNGWTISDAISDTHTVSSQNPVSVPAHGYMVLGIEGSTGLNGGVLVGYVYSNFLLGNSSDEIILSYKGAISDEVHYDGGPNFPDPKGASMNLAPNKINSGLNDLGSNWCLSKSKLPGGDFGTPFSPNDPCP